MESCILFYAAFYSMLSCVQLFVTPWTAARQAPLSVGFAWQEYCSGWPYPPPRDLPDPGIKPMSLMSPALAEDFFTTSDTRGASIICYIIAVQWLSPI